MDGAPAPRPQRRLCSHVVRARRGSLAQAICNARVRFPQKEADDDDDTPGGVGEADGGGGEAAPAAAAAVASAGAPSAAEGAPSAAAAAAPVSSEGISLVRKLLTKKAALRLGSQRDSDEVRAHPFFRPVDFPALLEGRLERPFVPSSASEVDVRHFEQKHTSHAAPVSAVEMDAAAEAEDMAAAKGSTARKLSLAAQEVDLASAAEARDKAAAAAKRAAAHATADAASDAELHAAEAAAAEAHKRVRTSQKKLRQCVELEELEAAGKALNSEQRKKLRTLPALRAELATLEESAVELDGALDRARATHAAQRQRVLEARAAAEAARVREEAKAAEATQTEIAKREQQARTATDLLELLTVQKFAYVAPEWAA